MSFDMRFFCRPEEVIHYISTYSTHDQEVFSGISVVVPTKAVKRTMMRNIDSLHIQWFSIHEYVLDLVYRANKVPHVESPIFTLLIREVMTHLVHQGNPLIKELEETLDPFERGYEGLYDAVRALISAGLREEDIPVMDSVFQEPDIHVVEKSRAQAVVLIASVMIRLLKEGFASLRNTKDCNLGIQEAAFAQASLLLQEEQVELLTPHVLFYGFPDFTGMQVQLFDEIVSQAHHVELLMYDVRDFAMVDRTVMDAAHDIVSNKLQEKTLHSPTIIRSEQTTEPPHLLFTSALGYQAELRDVLSQIQALLREGVCSEDIILVASSWDNYKPFLRYETERLNLPVTMTSLMHFSTRQTRQMESFIQLLLNAEHFSLSTILSLFSFDMIEREYKQITEKNKRESQYTSFLKDSDVIDYERVLLEDIQLYFQAFGLTDLEELDEKQVVLEESWNQVGSDGEIKRYISIPALIQMRQAQKKGVPVYQASRRKLPVTLLQFVNGQCLALLTLIKKLQESVADHSYRQVLEQICLVLGWSKRSAEWISIHSALERIEQIVYKGHDLTYRDFLSVLTKEIGNFGMYAFGKNENDSPSLLLTTLAESSGLFAPHMFVLGLNKGEVPSVFQADPLLTEEIRGKLHTVLPSLRTRNTSYLSERHRLYSLLVSCTTAHLSWIVTDELGQAASVSPLVRRLLLAYPKDQTRMARSLYARAKPDEILALRDRVLLSGVHGEQDTHRFAMSLYAHKKWSELYPELSEEQVQKRVNRVVKGRMEGIAELYPPLFSVVHKRIGPLGGMTGLGPLSGAIPSDPFSTPDPIPDHLNIDHSNFITRVEQYISCPWRNFLARLLRAEHTDDPQKVLPQLRPNTLGNIVHNTLEQLVYTQSPSKKEPSTHELEDYLPPKPFQVVWNDEDIQHHLKSQSKQQMFLDQQLWPHSSQVAYHMSIPYMEVERELELERGLSCLGAELEGDGYVYAHADGGTITFEQQDSFSLFAGSNDPIAIRVLFKADRIDVDLEKGSLLLLDYKTGRIPNSKAGASQKRVALIKEMKKGKKLQPAAYVSAYKALQKKWPDLQGSRGSLLYLKPDLDTDLAMREFSFEHDDEEGIDVFARVLWSASVGQALGINIPRLTQRKNKAPHSTNDWCSHCDFQRACRFHDSGFRKRLIEVCAQEQPESIPAQEGEADCERRIRVWNGFLTKRIWSLGEIK